MDGTSVDIFQSGIWLIPLILIATLAGLVWLVNHWRSRSQQDLKGLASRLRRLQGELSQVQMAAQDNTSEDPEPYGSLAAKLHTRLDQLDEQIDALQYERVGLQEKMNNLKANRWRALVGAPHLWYGLRKEIANLSALLDRSQEALAEADALERKLDYLSWEVAQQARQAWQTFEQVEKAMNDLRDRHIFGQTFNAAAQQETALRESLNQIPRLFLTGDQASLLEQADKEPVTQVHEIITAAQPILEELLSQAHAWLAMYAKTSEKVNHMSQAVDGVEHSLGRVPQQVQVDLIKAQLQPIKVVARTLRDTLSRLEIDNMELVAQEAERVAGSANEINSKLRRAGEQQATLELVVDEFTSGLKGLSLQFASLGTRSTHPIAWGPSVAGLTELNRAANEIGPPKKARSPEKIESDLARVVRLNKRQKELSEHCQMVERQHQELVALLDDPQLSQMNDWLAESQDLALQVSKYAPENWARADAVASLPDDIDNLAQASASLLPKSRSQTIKEGDLYGQLQATREMAESQEKIKKRLENIRSRLAELKKSEEETQESLKNAQTALNQIAFVVRSNTFLSDLAAQELDRLQAQVQEALETLQERQQGLLAKKERQANAILGEVEQSANRWLDQLTADSQKAVETIAVALNSLDKITSLDEPAVAEGRRLLSGSQAYQVGSYGAKSRFRLDELVSEFKRRSDYWQGCSAAASALHDVVEPVLSSFEDASYNRRATQDLLARVSTWLIQTNDWPPTSVSLTGEHNELERLEEQWSTLKGRPSKAINLVQQLGNLSAKYQTLAEKISQSAERAEHEQVQIEEIELDINEAAQMWQNHWYTYRENPEASQEIRDLLDDIEHELAQIRRYYKQKSRDYKQVLQTMKNLQRKLHYYQVALDEDHAIDSSGQVHARR